MTKTVKQKLAAIKYVENTKTGNVGIFHSVVELVAGGTCVECTPINSTKRVFWKNYKHVEVA